MYKEIIDEFVSINFNFLLECAKNIVKSKKTDGNDLVAELVLYLYDHPQKIEPYLDIDMLLPFSISWMNLQSKWKTTNFNRKYQINIEYDELVLENIADDNIPIPEDPYIQDLRKVYTDEQIKKILKVYDIYPSLSKTSQIIFKAYFEEGLSYDKIKDKYKFFKKVGNKIVYYKSKATIFTLMTNLKNEINNKL